MVPMAQCGQQHHVEEVLLAALEGGAGFVQ